MKKLIFLLLFCFVSSLIAQTPEGINYQAVLRDISGKVLKNEQVSIDVTIRTKNGANYSETIMTTTNEFGLLNVVLGKNGVPNNLKMVDWASGDGEIELSIQTSKGTINLGTQNFQNVPYAFHAETATTVENDEVDDADSDPQNEIQTLSFDQNSRELQISEGNKVNIPIGSGGDDWGSQTVESDNTINGNGTKSEPIGVNGDLTDDQTLSINGNMLSISAGNTIALPSGGGSLWNNSPFGIYTEAEGYIGHPDSFGVLHLSKNSVEFHVEPGDRTSVLTPEALWFNGEKSESKRSCDSLEFKARGVTRSNLSKDRLDFEGNGYQSKITKNQVVIQGAELDSYILNSHDSIGFTSRITGFVNGSTVQDPFSFKVRSFGSSGEFRAEGLSLLQNQKYVQLGLTSLTFGENGLGSYLNLSGNGFGDLSLLNAANWGVVNATARNDAGEVTLYDISGRANLYMGFRNGFKGTGSIIFLHQNKATTFSSTADSGAGFSQIYGPNGKVNIALTSRNINPNHGSISIIDANGNSQAGIYVDAMGRGVVWGDMKNFVTEHPEKENTDIWYGSLEGPEVAAYERGTSQLQNGKKKIELSDHFKAMSNTTTMTVILTPLSADTYGLAVIKKGMNGFTVKELKNGNGNFSFDWEVKCVRKGYENWRIERPSSEKEGKYTPLEEREIND